MNVIDQNQPYGENINTPATAAPIEPGVTDSQVAPEQNIPSTSSVVVPQNGGEVPKWFYFIFGATLIVFLVVTTLLVLQVTRKETLPANIVPTTIPQITSNAGNPTVSPTAIQTTESTSDDIASIEADLKTTDLTVLDTSLNEVEKEASF